MVSETNDSSSDDSLSSDGGDAAVSSASARNSSDRTPWLGRVLLDRDWVLHLNVRVSRYMLVLAGILILALAMRMYGTDWEQAGLFHPDERDFLGRVERLNFAELGNPSKFLSVESRLNPHWFNYGSLPLYVLAGWKAIVSPFTDLDWNIFDLRLPGRNLSALSDTITVFFVFLLARRLFDVRAALIAATFAALAVIHIQNAHYTAVDAPMTMFVTATIYFSVRIVQEGRDRDTILAGTMLGLAIASKFSAAPVAVAIGAAHLLNAAEPILNGGDLRSIRRNNVDNAVRGVVLAGAAALLLLVICQPYMIIDWSTYLANVTEQSEMVRRIRDYPFTRQYIDTTPYWYQIRQLSTWGLGIALGVLVWIGMAWAVGRALICRDKAIIVVLSYLVLYLLITGWFDVKFLRYMLPAVPLLLVFAGGFVVWSYDRVVRKWHIAARIAVYLVAGIAFASLLHYSFAYLNVFQGDHPAQQVSQWMRDNAEPDSVVIQEYWEEGIPHVPVHERIGMYEPDTLGKYDRVTNLMVGADYLILYSNRLSGTIPRLPERYPVGAEFYQQLFDGGLGYRYAYSADRSPELFGILYWDDAYARVPFDEPEGYPYPKGALWNWNWYGWADESHTVYEHPHAIVFENVDRLSKDEMLERLKVEDLLIGPGGASPRPLGLMLSETDRRLQQDGGTWRSVIFMRNLDSRVAWLLWLAVVQIIALAAVPLSYWIFRPLPDRGYLFSKPLGLLLVATAAWLLASYGVLGFSALSVGISIGGLALASAIIAWRLRVEMLAYFRAHIKMIAIAEVIFLAAFILFFVIRLANPDLWHTWRGGEKPMDFAYLNALTRSTVMPPYDPWFAGGYLNYYYFGQFIIATLIRVTGILPTIAYNLAVPLIFALTTTAAYAISYNLVALTMRSRGGGRVGTAPVWFGILAAVFVVVAANIDGLVQVFEGLRRMLVEAQPFGSFDYWRSSRMLEPGTGGNEITEFPWFTFLYGDLHAHMIALPFAIMALGLSISAFLRAGLTRISRIETITALAVLGITIGSLRLINSWDFPIQLLFAVGLIAIGEIVFGHRTVFRRFIYAGIKIVFVVVIGYAVFLPFHSNFELFNSGIERSQFHTPLWRYLAIHSIFLFAIFSWIYLEWQRGAFGFSRMLKVGPEAAREPDWRLIFIAFALGGVWVSIFFLFPNYATVFATFTGTAVLLTTVVMAIRAGHSSSRYIIIVAAIIGMALLLAAGVDLVTVKNDIGRQNTIFKFYIQAWWLLSIAATFAIWRLWDAGAFALRKISFMRSIWIAIFVLLAVGVSIYPVLGTRERLSDRFNIIGMGIDGEAYMDDAVYHRGGIALELGSDRPGIEWMRKNVKGSPVIVEGVWDLYTWTQRVSIYTGLPTVIGWDWHQTQQRLDYVWAIQERRSDVISFYSSDDVDQGVDFLEKYGVRYVYVGEMERKIYPEAGIEKFDRMESAGLIPVYEQGPVKIYEYHG